MPEPRINPEVLLIKEKLYSETDGKWYRKIDEMRSEAGAFMSLATASSGDVTSQITDDRSAGGTLTGVGTLTSAGIKFLLREILVASETAAIVSVHDGATTGNKKLRVNLSGPMTKGFTCLKGARFSTEVRLHANTGPVSVHLGGLKYVLQA